MEGSGVAVEGSADDHAGKKKSRFKLLKSRLFSRLKRKENQVLMKPSQSAGDVGARGGCEGFSDSEEDCLDPAGSLGSRALSHDSIFLADQAPGPAEPARVLSQENVQGKIRALQLKLQQQNMRLGPPPLLIPGKRTEDSGATSEDDGLPQSPQDMSFHDRAGPRSPSKLTESYRHHSSLSLAGTGSEEEEQWSSQPSSRPLSPAPPGLACPAPSSEQETSPGVDLTSPLQYAPSLDNSAARHRMSVKPRNQRASAKGRKVPARASRPRSESLSDLDMALPEGEEDREPEGEPNAAPDREPEREPRREERAEEGEREKEMAAGTLPEEQFYSPASKKDNVPVEPSAPPAGEDVVLQTMSSEPERKVTTNPLFLQNIPQETGVPSAEPSRAKSPTPTCPTSTPTCPTSTPTCPTSTPSCPTSTPSLKAVEEPQNPTQLVPSQPVMPHTMSSQGKREVAACLEQGSRSLSHKRESAPLNSVSGFDNTSNTREPSSRVKAGETPGTTSISSERPRPAPRARGTAGTVSARTTGAPPERAGGATPPPAGQDEELPVDVSSSHRFSVSSARHRSRNGRGSHPGARQEKGEREAGDQDQEVKSVEDRSRQVRGSSRRPTERRGGLKQQEGVPGEGGRQREEQKQTEKKAAMITEQKEDVEEERGRWGAFGAKLRPPSQSVKLRSDTIQSEDRIKRHSIEVMATEPQPIKKEDEAGSKVGRKAAGPEPVWMSVARERSRTLQQHLTSLVPSGEPQDTHTHPGAATLPQQPPRQPSPTPQAKPQTSQSSTLPSSSSSSPSSVRVRNRRPLRDRLTSSPSQTPDHSTDGTGKGQAGTLNTKSDGSSSSSPGPALLASQLPDTQSDQPSWMEVARKKAMAWNVKTMD
ncbi:CRACD-like protein [Osmerus eperlanus]|uniref:CRACD-like protein n=1 Tax=Osmerus eperlanus TaxID=29151 RepID=UPI002E14C33D